MKHRHASSFHRRRIREVRAAHGLLCGLFPRSGFLSTEIDRALDFAGRTADAAVQPSAEAIRRLVRWYAEGHPSVACRVLDAGAFKGGFLWVQAAVDRIVAGLQRGQPAVLFVTGTREVVRPVGHRWSRTAESERTESLRLIEERISRWSQNTGTPVSLFVS